jgi:uncharacterized protein (UPF0332 family)
MADWTTVATDNYRAASTLADARNWRSAVSRAYFAAYARASAALVEAKVTMPPTREGPSHRGLPSLINRTLGRLGGGRWRLIGLVHGLYNLRVAADYRPSVSVESGDARQALRMMADVFQLTKELLNG